MGEEGPKQRVSLLAPLCAMFVQRQEETQTNVVREDVYH